MKSTFFARRALLVLMVVFFLVPFAFRGARLALQSMKNDIRDWLPADFPETTELNWFRDHFLGEQFILVTWEGCSADDPRLKLLAQKLIPSAAELLAAEALAGAEHPLDGDVPLALPDADTNFAQRERLAAAIEDPKFIGNRLGLFIAGDLYENWGGKQEKWLLGKREGQPEQWYYITPDGTLYRWQGSGTVLGFFGRTFERWWRGTNRITGEAVAQLDPLDYRRPERIEARLFKTVTTGPQVLEELIREGGALRRGTSGEISEEEARRIAQERLEGSLFGPDGKQTCMIVTLTDIAKYNLKEVAGRGMMGRPRGKLLDLAEEAGIGVPPPPPTISFPLLGLGVPIEPPPPSLKLGGPPIDNIAIDEEGEITLVRLVGLCVLLGLTLSYLSFRSVKITLMLFFVGGVAAVSSLSFVWWFGSSVDAVLMSMPAVVYVLGLSGAIHIVNYYNDARQEHGLLGAPERAVAHGWKPCTLAAVTTAIGLGSLCTSNLNPIWKFGAFSALGVLATLILLFTYLPAALQMWPPRVKARKKADADDSQELHQFSQFAGAMAERMGNFIIRYNVPVAVVSLVVMLALGLGLTQIGTSVQMLKMFDRDAKIIADYIWIEEHMGKLIPMEVVLRFDNRVTLPLPADAEQADQDPDPAANDPEIGLVDPRLQYSFLERIEAVQRVHHFIEQYLGEQGAGVIGRGMSVATFTPTLPAAGGGFASVAERGAYNRRLALHFNDFLHSDYLRVDREDHAELWRISLRMGATEEGMLREIDYGAFVAEIKDVVEPCLNAYRCRDDVLRQIDEVRGPQGFANARVLLLGTPIKDRPQATAGEGDDPAEAAAPALPPAEKKIDQTQIFSLTLRDLLLNARLRLLAHDPRVDSDEALGRALDVAEFVVLVADAPAYDLPTIREKFSGRVIDLRDHRYDAHTAPQVGDPNHFQAALGSEWTGPDVAAIYTGVVPVVYKAQRTLLQSLIQSIAWSFVMITFVMMILLRSPTAGMISMFPNVFPVVVIFGAMGWSTINVDIGSMMTASVAMGVAVDDTIHYLTWFRWGLSEGRSRKEALMLAYRRVAPAMFQTTLIAGFGMFVFAMSTFTPTQRFGYLMLALLAMALVGDLIFLPALLAGPLGNVFRPSRKDTDAPKTRDIIPEAPLAAPVEHTPGADGQRATSHGPQPVEGRRAREPDVGRAETPHQRRAGESVAKFLREDQPHRTDKK